MPRIISTVMIIGAHIMLYSADAEADRAFLRDTLGLAHVDAGHGWLIFALPPSEAAVHPAATTGGLELSLMSDDLAADLATLTAKGVVFGAVHEAQWGSFVTFHLPSGVPMGLYEPRHPTTIGLAKG